MSRNGNQKMRWHWIVLIASMKTKLDMPEYAIGTKMGRYVLMMARVPVYAIVNDNYLGPLPDVRRSKREERSMMPVPSVYSCISDRGTCTSMAAVSAYELNSERVWSRQAGLSRRGAARARVTVEHHDRQWEESIASTAGSERTPKQV
ncbi:hypothetical protein M8818_005373 [Zalaria obscura]|uniref:Uncharacterized protein n=1 Tax=Zalaria obscura TaxID=2024903 RepID=A0ACC3SA20_9PEZI